MGNSSWPIQLEENLMREKTLEALKAAYVEMLREPVGSWRIENQTLYCSIRDAIADEVGTSSEHVQNCLEWYTTLNRK